MSEGGGHEPNMPPVVCGLPARPVDGRVPAHRCLSRCGLVSTRNANGLREILPQQDMGPDTASADSHTAQTAFASSEHHRRPSQQMLQLPFLLVLSSNLSIASV